MSDIEWTDATWTPFRAWGNEREALGWACEKVSEGCQHCYAETINRRLGTGLPYSVKAVEKSGGEHYLDEKALLKPLSWKKPRRIFVSSMTDVFGEWVPFDWLDRVFAVMALTPQHTYQVLTKRPERMREYVTSRGTGVGFAPEKGWTHWRVAERIDSMATESGEPVCWDGMNPDEMTAWPLANCWLGTSVENQHWADIRIPELLATPAAVRFLSCEPLLGPLDFDRYHPEFGSHWLTGLDEHYPEEGRSIAIDWVIVGGESGPKARPFDVAWARSIVAQCRVAGVAVFVKQLGAKPYDASKLLQIRAKNKKGGDMNAWPEDLRVREWPR